MFMMLDGAVMMILINIIILYTINAMMNALS